MIEVKKRFKLVGSEIEVIIYDIEKELCEVLFGRFYIEALRLQKIFNFYDPKSELSALNRKRKLRCSKELIDVINICLAYSKFTKGEYDISRGKEFLSRKSGKTIGKGCASYKDIAVKGNEVTLKNEDVLVDLGSAAKGYIGDRLCDFLKKEGVISGFLDMRGDVISFGKYPEKIMVQHPRDSGQFIYSFSLKNKCVATSGDYKQFYNNNYDECHIINKKDIISVTVVHESLALADAISTAIFVSGTKSLNKFSKERYLIVTKDLKIIKSKNFDNLEK